MEYWNNIFHFLFFLRLVVVLSSSELYFAVWDIKKLEDSCLKRTTKESEHLTDNKFIVFSSSGRWPEDFLKVTCWEQLVPLKTCLKKRTVFFFLLQNYEPLRCCLLCFLSSFVRFECIFMLYFVILIIFQKTKKHILCTTPRKRSFIFEKNKYDNWLIS